MLLPEIWPTQEMQVALERALMPGERVLWRSRPLGGRRSAEFWPLATGVPFVALGMAGMLGLLALLIVLHFAGPALGSLFLSPFLLLSIAIGVFMIRMPFREMERAARSLFAVTDFRTLRLVVGRGPSSESVMHGNVLEIIIRLADDGYGDVRLLTGYGVFRNSRYPAYFRMLGIPGPERVRDLIEQHRPIVAKEGE